MNTPPQHIWYLWACFLVCNWQNKLNMEKTKDNPFPPEIILKNEQTISNVMDLMHTKTKARGLHWKHTCNQHSTLPWNKHTIIKSKTNLTQPFQSLYYVIIKYEIKLFNRLPQKIWWPNKGMASFNICCLTIWLLS